MAIAATTPARTTHVRAMTSIMIQGFIISRFIDGWPVNIVCTCQTSVLYQGNRKGRAGLTKSWFGKPSASVNLSGTLVRTTSAWDERFNSRISSCDNTIVTNCLRGQFVVPLTMIRVCSNSLERTLTTSVSLASILVKTQTIDAQNVLAMPGHSYIE